MQKYRVFQILTGLAVLEGLLVSWFYFSTAAGSEKALSSQRLAAGLGLGGLLILLCGLLSASFLWGDKVKALAARVEKNLQSETTRISLAVVLLFTLFVNLLSLSIYFFPATQWLIPYAKTYALITVIEARIYLFQIWAVLILAKVVFFLFLNRAPGEKQNHGATWLLKAAAATWSLTVCTLILSVLWGTVSRDVYFQLSFGPGFGLLALSAWFSAWAFAETKNKGHTGPIWRYFIPGSIWLVVFLTSFQLAHWLNQVITPRESYWHLLADSFLHGRVYLPNPPSNTDLVYFNSHWYIPIPPLPAFVMLPFVAIFGVNGINATIISLCLGAASAVVIFQVLKEIRNLEWIKLSLSGQLWLVAFFAFGTVHLWLSIVSRVWYFTQICAVFFTALAFWVTLKKYPAWLTGLCLGAALLARPNLITLWPALAAIAIQLFQNEQGQNFEWKKALGWTFFSALPMIGAVGLLLFYNDLRFGNFFDFGYTTISSGGSVVADAQQYGIFSLHFLPIDLQTMFLALPDLNAQCNYFLPRGHGISMLAASPAILYVLSWPFSRKQNTEITTPEEPQLAKIPFINISWWSAGCWASIILSVGLLATYHNDGSIQYAYRYLIDFIVPVIMLIAFNARKRASLTLKLLILASVVVSYYGTISWFFSKC